MADKTSTPDDWMIYGAYGYTGRLIVEAALARGHRPVLAGRDPQRMTDMGHETGLPVRIFSLSNAEATRRGIQGMRGVLLAAGPFSSTAQPMLDACMDAKAHYLDITGEIDVFETIQGLDQTLKAHGIVAVPGVGFDVVPTDTVAALLHDRMPDATSLTLAFSMRGGGLSPGTAKTMVEGSGGRVRRAGHIVEVPALYKMQSVAFPSGPCNAVTIPWGDVSTAFHSTGIPNIEVYMAVTPGQLKGMRASARFHWLLKPKFVQAFVKARITRHVSGPSLEVRNRSHTEIWGEVRNDRGDVISLTMRAPEGYTLTAESSVRAMEIVLEGSVAPGAYTPTKAFGTAFALALPGVELLT